MTAVKATFGAEASLADPEAAATVARHWHTTGQTGCLFARMLGRQALPSEWPTLVVTDDDLDAAGIEVINAALAESFRQPGIQLLSIVLPDVLTISELKAVTQALHHGTMMTFFEDRALAGYVRVGGRVDVGQAVLAWIMAFGPFLPWPPTRMGPVTEFVIRTKPKRPGLFEKLNQDPSVAHLADIDLGLELEKVSRMFDGTKRATVDVLGVEPDELSAAKTTYSFTVEAWDAAGGDPLESGSLVVEPKYPEGEA